MLLFYFLAQHIIFSLQADAEIACNMWSLDFRFAQPSMQHLPSARQGRLRNQLAQLSAQHGTLLDSSLSSAM